MGRWLNSANRSPSVVVFGLMRSPVQGEDLVAILRHTLGAKVLTLFLSTHVIRITPTHNANPELGSGTDAARAGLLPGESVPPWLLRLPPTVPLPLMVPSAPISVPSPVLSWLLIASVPVPVLVSVLPVRFSRLLNDNLEPLAMSTVVSLCTFTMA